MTGRMDTLAERMQQLQDEGWTAMVDAEGGRLRCSACGQVTAPEHATVAEVARFEGASDPGDESALIALTPACGHRGLLVAMYGPGTPPETTDVVTRLPLRER